MIKPLEISDIKGYTPTQHTMRPETEFETKGVILQTSFLRHDQNVDHILKNTLDFSEIQKINGLDYIPDEFQEKIFEGMSQVQLVKEVASMRGDKFSLDMDQVAIDYDSPKPKF